MSDVEQLVAAFVHLQVPGFAKVNGTTLNAGVCQSYSQKGLVSARTHM